MAPSHKQQSPRISVATASFRPAGGNTNRQCIDYPGTYAGSQQDIRPLIQLEALLHRLRNIVWLLCLMIWELCNVRVRD
jgi:hypothetical protein